MYWILALVVTVELAWMTTADITIQVHESGRIRSRELSKYETYEYQFIGFPNANTLLLLNITTMRGLMRKDFRIYNSPIEGGAPSCWVYQKKDYIGTGKCQELWKEEYSRCVLGHVTDENCYVTFERRGPEQELAVDYKLVDCSTGKTIMNADPANTSGDSEQPSEKTIEKETENSQPEDSQLPSTTAPPLNNDPLHLATILPIVFTVAVFFLLLVVVACTCRKWSVCRKKPRPTEPEPALELPIYEEIPEIVDSDISRIEDPYNRLQTFVGTSPTRMKNGTIVYDSLNRPDKENPDTVVVGLLPPRKGEQRFN